MTTAGVANPLPLAGEGPGEGGANATGAFFQRTTLTLPSPASGRGLFARRAFIIAGGAVAVAPSLARATPTEVAAAIKEVTGAAVPKRGRVKLDIPVMVENGNAVGVTVGVEQEEPRCTDLYVFAEGNPLPRVLHASFGPAAGRTQLAARMRLATSQTVVAVARLEDGTFWTDSVDLIVTLAACLE